MASGNPPQNLFPALPNSQFAPPPQPSIPSVGERITSSRDQRRMEEEATAARLAETKLFMESLEKDVRGGFRDATGREPSPSEFEIAAAQIASESGRDFFKDRAFLAEQPGFFTKTFREAKGAVADVFRPVFGAAVGAVADRTQSLRTEDSSLPSVTLPVPGVIESPLNVFGLSLQNKRVGAEQLADIIELGVPFATEVAALGSKQLGPGGKATSIVLGNLSAEVGAEYLRYANLRASGVPNDLIRSNDPTDVALHFAKVASGGLILGGADIAFNASEIRAQRKAYQTLLGLGTEESNVALRRIQRLGVEPNLAQGMTTFLQPIATSLSVYPMTAAGSIKQSKKLVSGISATVTDAVSELGDRLLAGAHLSGKSADWAKKNDAFVQFTRKKGNAAFETMKSEIAKAEARLGTAAVHVDHSEAKAELETLVLDRIANLPLIQTRNPAIPFRLTETALERNPDFRLLDDVLNLPDEAPVAEYLSLRNQLEEAAARANGANDPVGMVFARASQLMHGAVENRLNAPPEVKAAFEAARREWSDYNSLANSAAWKHFRRADPQFGFANKVTDTKPATSAEVVLQNAMKDPDISPEIVGTWWRAAREGDAVPQFKAAVEAHIKAGLRDSITLGEKGPLTNVEVISIRKFKKFLGADDEGSVAWEARKAMIRNAGGDPDELIRFLDDAQVAFPDGIPNPSQTAARRTALSGVGSAVRFVTGASAIGGGLDSSASAIFAAAGSFIALAGVGQLMFNPKVLRGMRRVMNGGVDEQTRWGTLWRVAASVGMTRALQSALQEQGVDPLVTPTKAELLHQRQMNRSARPLSSSLPAPQGNLSPANPSFPANPPKIGPRN